MNTSSQRHLRRAGATLCVGALAVFLAGCSLWDKEEPAPACPRAAVLADAAQITKFAAGPGRDLTDIDYTASINQLTSNCEYDINKTTHAGTVTMQLKLQMQANRGPADRTHAAKLEYFVSVTDPNRRVLNKRTFDLPVPFKGNITQVNVDEGPVTLTIPIDAKQTSHDFDIFVGFQLTHEELRYNRQGRGGLR